MKPDLSSGLHDMRQSPGPKGATRGDQWYTVQVFVCKVCGAKTNRVIMGGWPGTGPRRLCPNAHQKWHWKLEDMLAQLHSPGHPRSYRDELKQEIEDFRKDIRKQIRDELKGNPDLSQLDEQTPMGQIARF